MQHERKNKDLFSASHAGLSLHLRGIEIKEIR